MVGIEVLTGVGRRRRWSRAEKERWVVALMEPGASSADIAREAGVDRGHLYRWRRELSRLAAHSGDIARFVPLKVDVSAPVLAAEPVTVPPAPGAIMIEFGSGISMKVEGAPDRGTLEQVIGVLSGAGRRR